MRRPPSRRCYPLARRRQRRRTKRVRALQDKAPGGHPYSCGGGLCSAAIHLAAPSGPPPSAASSWGELPEVSERPGNFSQLQKRSLGRPPPSLLAAAARNSGASQLRPSPPRAVVNATQEVKKACWRSEVTRVSGPDAITPTKTVDWSHSEGRAPLRDHEKTGFIRGNAHTHTHTHSSVVSSPHSRWSRLQVSVCCCHGEPSRWFW